MKKIGNGSTFAPFLFEQKLLQRFLVLLDFFRNKSHKQRDTVDAFLFDVHTIELCLNEIDIRRM